jgi:hypothetical protein
VDDRLRVRTIRVSTRAALDSGIDAEGTDGVYARCRELLTELERAVRDSGADPAIVAAIDADRRALDRAAASPASGLTGPRFLR